MKNILSILFLYCISVNAQYTSPFNKKEWIDDSTESYSFIVSGHFYGGGSNESHYPANTLLANLDWINESGADALICLGDLFKSIADDRPFYEKSFFDKLEIPLVNTVGNHDLTGSIYQDTYGETSFMFEHNKDLHIIIDTELDNGDIVGDQLSMLNEAKEIVNKGEVNNVFVYGHRTIWKESYEEMEGLFVDNTQGIGTPNFKSDIIPVLKEMEEKANVFWFSGSLGTAPASFFHFEDKENGFEIIATAIRALPRDAVLLINVDNGEVSFEPYSFTGQDLNALNTYDVAYWQNTVGEKPFNWKLTAYYFEVMFTHRYFWYGCLYTIFGISVLFWFFRRRKRKMA